MNPLIIWRTLFLIVCLTATRTLCDKLNEKRAKYRELRSKLCDHSMAVYKVKFYGNWKRELFPKQFPDWRPPAQWSKTYGRTHDVNGAIYRLNDMATPAVRLFAEMAKTDKLESGNTKNTSTFDEFIIPNIPTGDGVGSALFFVDDEHPFVSLVTKMIPSPDWFIGVDSVNLMDEQCRWRDFQTVEVQPLDGGSESGLTFSAPKWPTEPQVAIRQITSRWPNHYAGSFFNPDIKKLPAIGKFSFFKLREYKSITNIMPSNRTENIRSVTRRRRNKRVYQRIKYTASSTEPPNDNEITSHIDGTNTELADRLPADCQVSEWTEWAPCSKTCGLGETWRSRTVTKYPERGGGRCPDLKEVKWCGSARCREQEKFFNW